MLTVLLFLLHFLKVFVNIHEIHQTILGQLCFAFGGLNEQFKLTPMRNYPGCARQPNSDASVILIRVID